MKRTLVIALIVLMAMMLAGCTSSYFTIVERGFTHNVVYDNETKVMYLQGEDGRIEVMLNADGTPRIWEDR